MHGHLPGQDELVEAPRRDLGQRGPDPVQEVLVGSRRREAELVGRRGGLTWSSSREDLLQAGEQLVETLLRSDEHDRRRVLARRDHRHFRDEQLSFRAAVKGERPERDRYRPGLAIVTGPTCARGGTHLRKAGDRRQLGDGMAQAGGVREAAGKGEPGRRAEAEDRQPVALDDPPGLVGLHPQARQQAGIDRGHGVAEAVRGPAHEPVLGEVRVAVTHCTMPPLSRCCLTSVKPASARMPAKFEKEGRYATDRGRYR